jgi:hypothetical protein
MLSKELTWERGQDARKMRAGCPRSQAFYRFFATPVRSHAMSHIPCDNCIAALQIFPAGFEITPNVLKYQTLQEKRESDLPVGLDAMAKASFAQGQ